MLDYEAQTLWQTKAQAPLDVEVLDRFFGHNVAAMVTFFRDTWLPEQQRAFLDLATAIRGEQVDRIHFITHRIDGCAAMGGAHEIVEIMDTIDSLAHEGEWFGVRRNYSEAAIALLSIAQWFDLEYGHLTGSWSLVTSIGGKTEPPLESGGNDHDHAHRARLLPPSRLPSERRSSRNIARPVTAPKVPTAGVGCSRRLPAITTSTLPIRPTSSRRSDSETRTR